jgi:hypothetical protein
VSSPVDYEAEVRHLRLVLSCLRYLHDDDFLPLPDGALAIIDTALADGPSLSSDAGSDLRAIVHLALAEVRWLTDDLRETGEHAVADRTAEIYRKVRQALDRYDERRRS